MLAETPFPVQYQCWQVLARSIHSDEQASDNTKNHSTLDEQFSSWSYFTKQRHLRQLLFYIGSEAFTSMTHYVVNNKSVLILPGEWCLTSFVYNIEQNDADFVVCHDVLVQKNWNNISHVIFDLLPFRICSHCQVLKIIHDKRIKHIIYM